MKKELPLIGFDRFIELDWANYALDIALQGKDNNQIKTWISERISGKDSARKTANLLSNLWLVEYSVTAKIRTLALEIVDQVSIKNRAYLHWGMAYANFPLFKKVVTVMNQLMNIQGVFSSKDVIERILESYSNVGSIPRCVARIIQSLVDWEILVQERKSFYSISVVRIDDQPGLLRWLLLAQLYSQLDDKYLLKDIPRAPILSPFDMIVPFHPLIISSPLFSITREGNNEEYVSLSNEMLGI